MRATVLLIAMLLTYSRPIFAVGAEAEILGHFLLEEISQNDNANEILPEVIEFLEKARKGQCLQPNKQRLRDLLIDYEKSKHENLIRKKLEEAAVIIESIKTEPDIHEVVEDRVYFRIIKPPQIFDSEIVGGQTRPLFHLLVKNPEGSVLIDTSNQEPIYQDLRTAIEGFTLGVVGMKQGEKRIIYIHPEYGYGDRDLFTEPSLLIVEVELVSI